MADVSEALTKDEQNHIKAMAGLDVDEFGDPDPQVPHVIIAVNTILAHRAEA